MIGIELVLPKPVQWKLSNGHAPGIY